MPQKNSLQGYDFVSFSIICIGKKHLSPLQDNFLDHMVFLYKIRCIKYFYLSCAFYRNLL